jgi:hypothetical protein
MIVLIRILFCIQEDLMRNQVRAKLAGGSNDGKQEKNIGAYIYSDPAGKEVCLFVYVMFYTKQADIIKVV